MRRCEDEKVRYRPPLLEEPCAQTLSGMRNTLEMKTSVCSKKEKCPCRARYLLVPCANTVVQLVSRHSCVADRLPVVVRFPAG